jgi:hypothetical protein
MNMEKNHEFHIKKVELVEKISSQIAPLLDGLSYGQIWLLLDAIREKILSQTYFISNHEETPQTIHRS